MHEEEALVVAFNTADRAAAVRVPVAGIFRDGGRVIDALTRDAHAVEQGFVQLTVPGPGGAVLGVEETLGD